MEEHFFTERGMCYRTNDLVPGRLTLVLIHGLSGSASAWAVYEKAWEGRYNIVSMDLRGHGKSLKPDHYDDYTLEKLADDIAALLDQLHIGPYVAISQSYATLIAVLLLRIRPHEARAAVFMSSVYGISSIFLTRVSRVLVRIAAQVARWFRYAKVPSRHVDYELFRNAGDWSLRRISNDIPNTTLHVWLFCLDHVYGRELDPLWREIKVPTLIMHGRRDKISPVASALRLVSVLPHAKLIIIESESHVFPITQPERACGMISEYLSEL